MRFLALLLAFATSASAAPQITSITPNSGRVAGGEIVTIKGSGFSNCIICSPPAPPAIFFGRTPARSVRLIDETTIEVTVPPLLQGRYDVSIEQFDQGTFTLRGAFTVLGEASEGFETILLPIYMPPVFGAFGSEFQTLARASNRLGRQPVYLYGADYRCLMTGPAVVADTDPLVLDTTGLTFTLPADCSNWPARLLYVPHDQADSATLNLRVADVAHASVNHGTEIPIVRSADMRSDRLVLLEVPVDPFYRDTLRIYSPIRTDATVRVVIANQEHRVQFQPGVPPFTPSVATFYDFPSIAELPAGVHTVRIVVEAPENGAPIWAFITVTNNETQQITTITPD